MLENRFTTKDLVHQPSGVVEFKTKKKKKLTDSIYEIALDLGERTVPFTPGQYVHIILPELVHYDPRGNGRDFSIASSPTDESLKIAFKKSESGFKKTLMQPSAHGTISGPFGAFILPQAPTTPIVCIAGGIGITPFMSMLTYVTEKHLLYDITILYGNSHGKKGAYLDVLEELKRNNPKLSVHLYEGKLTQDYLKQALPLYTVSTYYIAGPPQMVSSAQALLEEIHVHQEQIHTEEFSGYNKLPQQKPLEITRSIPMVSEENVHTILGSGITGEFSQRSPSDLEALLQTLSSTALVSETNTQGTITFANDKFVEVSKYTKDELIGQNHRILKSGYHSQAFYVNLWATITRGKLWRGLLKNKAKDGSFYWVDTSIAPIIGEDGKPIKYISVRFPITERQQAEEKLQEWGREQNVLMTLSQEALSAPNLISLWDICASLLARTLRVEYCAILKYLPDGQKLLYESGIGFSHVEKGMTIISAGEHDTLGSFLFASNEPVIIEDLSTESRFIGPSLLHDQGIVSGVCASIQGLDAPFGTLGVYASEKRTFSTDDINFIQAVANLLANAIRNQLDKRKDEFLGIASHEMKTPLTSIKTFTQLLLDNATKEQNNHSIIFLSKIDAQINRIADLINDLLDISRINTGKVEYKDETFSINELVSDLVKEHQLITKRHKISLKNGPMVHIFGDKYRIAQVVTNMLTNAIKYSPDSEDISVSIERNNNKVIVSVKDSGVGIPREEQGHIFDRFYQGNVKKRDKFPGGLGLGLYISSNIIKRHNGQLGVESEEGKGSTFFFSLPIQQSKNTL